MARPCDCQKYVVLWCNNFILGIVGISVSISAIIFLTRLNTYEELGPEDSCGPSASLIILGIFTLLLSVYSYKITCYSNRIQVILFLIYIGVLIFITVFTEIWAIVKYFTITEPPLDVLETLKQSLVNVDKDVFWNNTLTSLKCCGVFGLEDYVYLNFTDIPETCNNTYTQTKDNEFLVHGCAFEALNYTKSVMLEVIHTILGLIIYEGVIVIPLTVQRLWILNKRKLRLNRRKISSESSKGSVNCRKYSREYEITTCDNGNSTHPEVVRTITHSSN